MRDELFCIRRSGVHARALGIDCGTDVNQRRARRWVNASFAADPQSRFLYELTLWPETFARESFGINNNGRSAQRMS